MFASANFVGPLPPPAPGHYRALRVESVGYSHAGGSLLAVDWSHLPTPQAEGGTINSGEVCAAWPNTFEEWFPELDPQIVADLGKQVVALDVPHCAAKPLTKQLVIDRDMAKVVAVLLH